jgi:hypothetical protein
MSLGMAEQTECFAEERIEIDVLSELTDQDLDRLGIPPGRRRRMLKPIRERGGSAPVRPHVATAAPAAPQVNAERRQLTVMFCELVGDSVRWAVRRWLKRWSNSRVRSTRSQLCPPQRALSVAHRQKAKSWELGAAMSMARLLRGSRPTICSPRSTAGSPRASTRWDLKQAKALLDELR